MKVVLLQTQSVAFSVAVKHNGKNVGEVRGTMIGNVNNSWKNICKLNGMKMKVKWMVSFTSGVQTVSNTVKNLKRLLHYQVQSASLRVVHFFSQTTETVWLGKYICS